MKKYILLLSAVLIIFLAFPSMATKVNKDAEEATHVFIGKVEDVQGYYDFNEWNDHLIFSRVRVRVEKELKGKAEKYVSFSVEGGTVGEIGLRVSEAPVFKKGEIHKFYLKKEDAEYKLVKQEAQKILAEAATCCATFARWPTTSAPYYINPANNDMTTSCALREIQGGAGAWGPDFDLLFQSTTTDAKVKQNYKNIVFFRKVRGGSTIAVTYTWYYTSTGQIIEFDMIFYDGWKFFSFENGCPNACNDGFFLKVIAAHEFGHSIGLDHNDCGDSLMYPYASYCDTGLLSGDDRACVAALY